MRISKSNKASVKASNEATATSTDRALKHIRAAIDILGKSGNRDAITKDSIANLATVMFDIKASTIVAGESAGEYKGYTIYRDNDAGEYYIYTQSKGEGRMDFESDKEAQEYIDSISKED